ncbi:MAG: DUF1232 domain-containing protein [Sphingomonas sp.]|nr:DUF1232 domain-containing protein [Sphingomonas sp.]
MYWRALRSVTATFPTGPRPPPGKNLCLDARSTPRHPSQMPGPTLAHRIRTEAHAVWLAARDPRTPIAAKLVGLLVAAYALSPIDLIPDFIPVIGLLDDAILIPIGIWLFERLVPADLMTEHRARAAIETERPVSLFGILIVVAIWAACAWLVYSIVATSGYE